MTVVKGLTLSLTLAIAGALAHAAAFTDSTASSNTVPVRLKAINARVDSKGASLVVEASEPVPYLTTRPDPLTVLLDFRNVDAQAVTKNVSINARSPIAGVTVENVEELGGSITRVRIALSEPVAHHVRSDKSSVIVEFEKADGKGAPYVMAPASRTAPGAAHTVPDTLGAADPIAALNLQTLGPDRVVAPVIPPAAVSQGVLTPALGQPPAAPATAPAPVVTTPGSAADQAGAKKYTGTPVSFDFQDADLRAVLRTFHEITGLNMVIDPKVTGTVNVALTDVPWDQALDIILRTNGLAYQLDGTIVRIAPIDVFTAEDRGRKAAADARTDAEPLSPLTRQLSYARGEDIIKLLTDARILSLRGVARSDPRTNTIVVKDIAANIDQIQKLIDTLDKPQRQVEIEARIVQANKTYARAIGVQWGFNGQVSPALGNTTNLAFPNSGSVSGATGATGSGGQPSAVNLAAPAATSAVGLALGSVNGAFNLDMALSAAETSGNLKILSTPRVSTQNNGEAEITQGIQIPIQTVANNTISVTFRDAALTLRVTPQITAVGTVIMKISLENSQADFSRSVNGIPPINTQRANTQVQVSDGQTTVIGGIYTSTDQTQHDSTPGLSRIPFLSWLFKRDTINDQSQELLIFITPRIIQG